MLNRNAQKKINSGELAIVTFDLYKQFNYIAFFIIWLRNSTESIWSNPWVKYLNAPVAMATSLITIILSWRQVYLAKGQDGHAIFSAVIETLTGAAIIAAAIIVVAAVAAYAFVVPFLLVAALGVKSLFNLGSAIYFAGKAWNAGSEGDDEARLQNRDKAKESFVSGLAFGALTGVGITLILVAAPVVQVVMASIGLAVSAFGVLAVIYKVGRLGHESREIDKECLRDDEPHHRSRARYRLTNGAELARNLGTSVAHPEQIQQVETMLASQPVTQKSALNEQAYDNDEVLTAVPSCRA